MWVWSAPEKAEVGAGGRVDPDDCIEEHARLSGDCASLLEVAGSRLHQQLPPGLLAWYCPFFRSFGNTEKLDFYLKYITFLMRCLIGISVTTLRRLRLSVVHASLQK